tara:strand:+ start:34 stop:390 length:357 start_codon:yes stop_codon:yes gene_type:complete
MAIISSQSITESGIDSPTRTVATLEGDTWENSGSEFIEIQNNGEASVVVTFTPEVVAFTSPQYGLSQKAARTLTVAAGISSVIGPFSVAAYNNDTGYASITYSSITDITVAIFTVDSN